MPKFVHCNQNADGDQEGEYGVGNLHGFGVNNVLGRKPDKPTRLHGYGTGIKDSLLTWIIHEFMGDELPLRLPLITTSPGPVPPAFDPDHQGR